MTAQTKPRMTVAQFIEWAAAQPRGRYELVRGEIVAMAPERARHNLAKFRAARALDDAIRRAGLPCTVFTDGMTVVIDNDTAREPDAAVQCSTQIDPNSMILEAPLIVVEVVSPSSERDDTTAKLAEYFSVPGLRHYLIVHVEKELVIHHLRDDAGEIRTRILSDGAVAMTPPGLAVPVRELLGKE